MPKGKMLDDNAIRGDAGIALIHRRVSQMRHAWREWGLDAGIDGAIELRNPATGEMSNQHLLVQSKTSGNPFPGETDEKFHYICSQRDIDYWMKADTLPVLLVCSHPETGDVWWAHVQAAFSDPARRAARRIEFDKATQRLAGDMTSRLFAIVDPHGRAHTTVADPIAETLVSNLIPIEFPDTIWVAQTAARKPGHVYKDQRRSDHPIRSDFVLSRGRIFAWAPIVGTALIHATHTAANPIPAGELAGGNEDERRLFVQLLQAALQHDLRDICQWNNSRRFLYFKPTPDLTDQRALSASGHQRIAFKGYYQRKDDPTKRQFYRHAALRTRFTEIDNEWFCSITPDYYFTNDGFRESAFADDYLSNMKRMDRNQAVLGETQLWFGLLGAGKQPTLLDHLDGDAILDFGEPLTLTVDRGLIDKDWAQSADVSKPATFGQMALAFEDFQ